MKKVWVVEDDPSIREIISILLLEEGYDVRLFENASKFVVAINTSKDHVDVIVMDIRLPDGNGVNLCHKVKTSENFSQVPVLMMSADATFGDVERFCRADDYIPKPFDIREMVRKVARLSA